MQYRSFIGGSLSPLVLVRGEASESVPRGKTYTASERSFLFLQSIITKVELSRKVFRIQTLV